MTQFDRKAFEEVCEGSGLTMSELATLYGVTRQTLYNWRKGMRPTQGLIARLAGVYTSGLHAAIKRGVLPMRGDLTKEARTQRIRHMAIALHGAAQRAIGQCCTR